MQNLILLLIISAGLMSCGKKGSEPVFSNSQNPDEAPKTVDTLIFDESTNNSASFGK